MVAFAGAGAGSSSLLGAIVIARVFRVLRILRLLRTIKYVFGVRVSDPQSHVSWILYS